MWNLNSTMAGPLGHLCYERMRGGETSDVTSCSPRIPAGGAQEASKGFICCGRSDYKLASLCASTCKRGTGWRAIARDAFAASRSHARTELGRQSV